MQRVIISNINLRNLAQVLFLVSLTFSQSVDASIRGINQVGIEADNISIRQFVSTETGAAVFYILQAEKQLRTVDLTANLGLFLFQKSEMAKINHYLKGSLFIANQEYFFEKAYWFQGELILQNVSAIMEQGNFKAKELRFNPLSRRLFAERIQIVSETAFIRKLNWNISVNKEAFLPGINSFN
ncbi:hypothetical protein [Shewanella sp. TC10]|uniref:hypothetical protein n=1 Tax=Shewanella sp. TC10 TaxID=1419739 RepID=UPI00129D77E7|nr:hypothetical protein [Shewanella sp. TC10]